MSGMSLAQSGFVMGPLSSPDMVGRPGVLAFQLLDESGTAQTEFEKAHGKDLHLIVVRSDGTGYRHVHPRLDASTGTWSLPWEWDEAGTYRVYADFTGGDRGSVTLSRTVDVSGMLEPRPATAVVRSDPVDGFAATIAGELVAGEPRPLTVEVTRDGAGVSDLEPYLGAFGHLVALRQGDLAYMHVHALGAQPEPGALGGPTLTFVAHPPTVGRYLLYLDFQVAGQVRSARFVLDATASSGTPTPHHTGHH